MRSSVYCCLLLFVFTSPIFANHGTRISISPTSATVSASQSLQFAATVKRTNKTAVIWKVNETVGGNSAIGTISPNGLYRAPATVPWPGSVMVTATSVANLEKSDSASVTITGPTILWSANHETGNLSQWSTSGGGGEFNIGAADSVASQDFAHSGLWSAKMTITNPGASNTNLSRWAEPQNHGALNYTVWYYFPQRYSAPVWWNVMQWLSVSPTKGVFPFYILNVGNRSDGSMHFYLFNRQTRQSTTQTLRNIPVGQWIKLDAYYQCAGDDSGRITIWQDGAKLFDVSNVSTRYSDGNCEWSTRNNSDSVSPSPVTIYVDDAAISTGGGFGSSGTTSPLLTLSTTNLPSGTTGTGYSANLAASGGTSPYSWSFLSGGLPPGLTISGSGVISGTPTSVGTFGFAAQVRDSASQTATSATLTIQITAPVISSGNVIWSADHEDGNMNEWYLNNGGGEFNSGVGDTVISTDIARTGNRGIKMTITTPPESGTRMFRWYEPQRNARLQYSAWFYFPQRFAVSTYWNIFQWKSKRSSSQIDPFFVLNIGNRSDGSMFVYLYDWQTRRAYSQSVRNLPVNQWVKLEAYYQCAGDSTGRVTFWQDGIQLYDLQNVRTRYSDGDCQWSIDNYSNGVSPSPAVIYADDAEIILK